jgi:hypothetical protein
MWLSTRKSGYKVTLIESVEGLAQGKGEGGSLGSDISVSWVRVPGPGRVKWGEVCGGISGGGTGHKVRPRHVGHGVRSACDGVSLARACPAAREQPGERLAGDLRYS